MMGLKKTPLKYRRKTIVIVVKAMMHVKEGKGPEFEAAYHKAAAKVLKDPGALAYVLHRDNNDPTKYFFYEKYENQEAIKYHSTTAHFKEFFKAIGQLTIGEPEINMYTEVK
jgi:quinol monooxygenase YgiN